MMPVDPTKNAATSAAATDTAASESRAEKARTRWQSNPQPDQAPAPVVAPVSPRPRVNILLLFLYVLTLISLMVNAYLIRTLVQVRDTAYASLQQVITAVGGLENEVISIPVHIEQEFPVNVAVPFEYKETLSVSTEVPISDTLQVPFEVMGTKIDIDVPVNMVVPVSVNVPVSFSKTFDISTTVPVVLDTTVEVRLSDTPLPGYLTQLRQTIQNLKFP